MAHAEITVPPGPSRENTKVKNGRWLLGTQFCALHRGVEARLPSPPVAMESRIAIALIAVALLCGAAPAVAQTKTQITVRRAPHLSARDVNPAVCSRLTRSSPRPMRRRSPPR